MDEKTKKQLIAEYKNRTPEPAVISVRCKTTGQTFYGVSMDPRADFNSVRAKLSFGGHPNKKMQALWKQYGADDFDFDVAASLEYKDPAVDYKEKLEEMRNRMLEADPVAEKIWK